MSLFYINGVRAGAPSGNYPGRHFPRLLYLWLTKVVGWSSIDVSGSKWDSPIVASKTDGVTGTNGAGFTSASGSFINAGVQMGDQLVIKAGFTDATKRGIYEISSVLSATQLAVYKTCGVHHTGLPSSQSGVTYEIHRLNADNMALTLNDYCVLAGTGAQGAFHLKISSVPAGSYDGVRFEISPWAEWNAVAHAWGDAAKVALPTGTYCFSCPNSGTVDLWGLADQSFAMLCARDSYWTTIPYQIYLGELTPKYPDYDPRPIGFLAGNSAAFYTSMYNGLRMIGTDQFAQQAAYGFYVKQSSGNYLLTGSGRDKCYYSGKYIYLPVLVGGVANSVSEVRGYLKHTYFTHSSNAHYGVACGLNREFLRFNDLLMDWNGSKQQRTF